MFSTKINCLRKFSTNVINLSAIKFNPVGGLRLVDGVVSVNDQMYAGWHPDIDFPYEYSKPIPNTEVIDSASLIKDDALNNAMVAYANKHPEVARQELMKLTYTTKHRWYPRARDKRAKKTPMDREYL